MTQEYRMQELISRKALATRWGVDVRTVWRWQVTGRIPPQAVRYLTKRIVRYDWDILSSFASK